jgi:hypothetical protein
LQCSCVQVCSLRKREEEKLMLEKEVCSLEYVK